MTPFFLAAYTDNSPLASALLDAGADDRAFIALPNAYRNQKPEQITPASEIFRLLMPDAAQQVPEIFAKRYELYGQGMLWTAFFSCGLQR